MVRAALRARANGEAGEQPSSSRARLSPTVELPGLRSRPAAVLCAVFDEPGGPVGQPLAHVLLTRRAANLRSHTGEISFPGGRVDPGETALQAARREAQEEVGLDPATADVVGTLSQLTTVVSEARIDPFVAVLPGRPSLRINRSEVDEIIIPTLDELCSPGVYHEELWPLAEGWQRVHFFDLVGDTVWGATARMLRELIDLIWAASQRSA